MQEFAEVAKVKVDQAGTIYLNGKTVSTEELKQEFSRLKQVKGEGLVSSREPAGRTTNASDGSHPGYCRCKAPREAA